MKKTLYILLSAMTVIAAASCAKKEIEEQPATPDPAVDPEEELVDMTFSAGADLARVYIAEGTKLYWEDGDDIAIFDNLNPETPRKFEISNINGNTADFNGQVAKGSTEFYAVYPYSAAVSLSDGNLVATLPGEQKLGEHNASQGAFLAVGKVKNGNIEFVNVFGRIKINVTYSDVSEIIVSGDNMSGTATFNSETGELVSVSDAKGSAKLLPKEGDAVFTHGTYYLSLLPGTTEAGKFTVTMKRPVINYDGELAYSATQVATDAVTVKRGGGINFAEIDTKLTWTIHLGTKAELLAWNNAYQQWKANDNVYLDNDIVLDNEPGEWTSHPFPGTFDGQGNAITKIHVEKAGDANFFGTVSGTVKNLKVGATGDGSLFKSTSTAGSGVMIGIVGVVADGGQLTDIENYATIEAAANGANYVGAICGRYNSKKTMSGCKNHGKVLCTVKPEPTLNLAGLIGSIGAVTTIQNCENDGDVTFEATTTGSTINHAGLVGYSSVAATLDGCVNSGAVTLTSAMTTFGGGYYRLGGIMGFNQGSGVTFKECRNSGELKAEAAGFSKKNLYMGGMLGQNASISSTGVSMTDCVNSGDITAATKASGADVAIGGMIGYRACASDSDSPVTGTLTSCQNLGSLQDISARAAAASTYIGGMIGYNLMGVTLTNCENGMDGKEFGAVTVNITGSTLKYLAISGMIGWQGTVSTPNYINTVVKLSGCHNYADVTNDTANNGQYVYLGSMIAGNEPSIYKDKPEDESTTSHYYSVTIDGCINDGAITNHTSSSSQIRMGGFIGDGANYFDLKNSINNGNVLSDGNSAATGDKNISNFQYRVGGFVGSITKGANNEHNFINLYNHGNVTGTTTSTSPATPTLEVGGIIGFLGYTDEFIDCKCNAIISSTGATNNWARAIVGNTSKACTISNCGVAGKVDGTILNSENFGSFIYHSTKAVTATNPNYYLGSSNNEQYSPLDNDINLE